MKNKIFCFGKVMLIALILSNFFSNLLFAQLSNSPWPMEGCDNKHTCQSKYEGSQIASLKWKFKTSGSVYSSPVIGSDGTVYLNSPDDYLYAIHPNGTLRWKFKLEYTRRSCPAIGSDGTIYAATSNTYAGGSGNLYAINPDGSLKWKCKTGYGHASSPTIGSDGNIYVVVEGYLYSITSDGILKGKFYVYQYYSFESPTIGVDGTIYVKVFGKLYAINPNGTLKWEYRYSEQFQFSPAIGADGTLYSVYHWALVTSKRHGLLAITSNGIEKWRYKMDFKPTTAPAISYYGTIYFGAEDNYLYAFTLNGNLKWKYQTQNKLDSFLAIGLDGTIYCMSCSGYYLYAINPNGTLKWKFQANNFISSPPAISSDGTVYFTCTDQNLYAIGKASGPKIVVSDASLHFSKVEVGKSKDLTLTIFNGGDTTLSISSITSSSSEFEVSPSSFTLESGSSMKVTVTFTPSSQEGIRAILTIISNDKSNSGMKIYLSGNFDYQELKLYLQPDYTLNEIPYEKPGTTSWEVTHFIYPTMGPIEWKCPLKGYIYGESFFFSVVCGCIGLGETQFNGEIILRTSQFDTILASAKFQGGPVSPWPFQPQRISRIMEGTNPGSSIDDSLIFRVTAIQGNVGVIIYGEPIGQSYVTIPIVVQTNVPNERLPLYIPKEFELNQNYPNPFNPETTIKYQLPEPSEVTIRIFNITGQVVKTILDEHRPEGYHSILWDGKDDVGNHVTSGVYFYQLCARTDKLGQVYAETRKMVLVR